MKIIHIKIHTFIILLFIMLTFSTNHLYSNDLISGTKTTENAIQIAFDYTRLSGIASNQFAVWIEDLSGNYVKTIYVTQFTAKKGWKNRPDSIPLWVKSSKTSTLSKVQIDSISSATPKSKTINLTWDFSDYNSLPVADGEYKILIEGSIRWKYRVLYSAIVNKVENSKNINIETQYSGEKKKDENIISNVSILYKK